MRIACFLNNGRALLHTEPVLLIRDNKAEAGIFHVVAEKGMGTDYKIDLSVLKSGFNAPFFSCSGGTGKQLYAKIAEFK